MRACRSASRSWAQKVRNTEPPGVDLDDAEQVLQAPGARAALGPQRVALEVEEDVAGARSRHPAQGVGVGHLGADATGGVALLLELEPGLLTQPVEGRSAHVGDRLGAHRELVDGRDAGVDQLAAGRPAHPGHEQEVAGGLDLGLADLAPAAGEPQRVAPAGRPGGVAVCEQQRVEAGAAGEVDGHDVVEGEVAHVTAADDEPGDGGRWVRRPRPAARRTRRSGAAPARSRCGPAWCR